MTGWLNILFHCTNPSPGLIFWISAPYSWPAFVVKYWSTMYANTYPHFLKNTNRCVNTNACFREERSTVAQLVETVHDSGGTMKRKGRMMLYLLTYKKHLTRFITANLCKNCVAAGLLILCCIGCTGIWASAPNTWMLAPTFLAFFRLTGGYHRGQC